MSLPNVSPQLPHIAPINQEGSDTKSEFLTKLFNLLQKGILANWIRWHQDGGIFIEDVPGFVNHVLHVYFPDMKKEWASFQRQMSLHGFKKRERNKTQAHYVHWNNKFCRDRPDLLPEVKAPPKECPVGHLPAPNAPAVPQPPPKEWTSTYPSTVGHLPAFNALAVPQPLPKEWMSTYPSTVGHLPAPNAPVVPQPPPKELTSTYSSIVEHLPAPNAPVVSQPPPKEWTSTYPSTVEPLPAPNAPAVSQLPPKEWTSTYTSTAQGQPPASNTPAVPQPLDWIDPDAGTIDIGKQLRTTQKKVAELERRLLSEGFEAVDMERQLEITGLEGKLEVAKLKLEIAELERKLEVADLKLKVAELEARKFLESEARKVSELERQLKDKDAEVKELSSQLDLAWSLVNSSTSCCLR